MSDQIENPTITRADTQVDSPGTSLSDALAVALQSKFETWKAARVLYEQEWLKDLRQYLGEYDPELKKRLDPNRSQANIRNTRSKVRSLDARMMDMLFPAGGDKNWAIRPTPMPNMVEQAVKMVSQAVLQKAAIIENQAFNPDGAPMMDKPITTGMGAQIALPPIALIPPPSKPSLLQKLVKRLLGKSEADELEDGISEYVMRDARERCERMSKTITEQLDECKYALICKAAIHSGNLFGTGVIKGPLVEVHEQGHWTVKKTGDGESAEYSGKQTTHPYVESVPIWDVFPDMTATDIKHSEGIFQRHVKTKAELLKLARRPDFNAQAIYDHMKSQPGGDATPLWYESVIRAINQKTTRTDLPNRFQLLEYWGFVDAEDLKNLGIEVGDDPRVAFEANVWILGNRVIKAALNPFDANVRPYHFYYCDKDESGVFGIGIPRIMRDSDAVFQACIRAIVDNTAMSAGPMFDVCVDLLAPGEDPDIIAPFRAWHRKSTDGANPAIRTIQVPNVSPGLMEIAAFFKQLGDESTAVPAYQYNAQTSGIAKTVGGLSMIMGASNVAIKDTVRNFDDGITIGLIQGMFEWNMQFNPDQMIKGDYCVEALGATSLVAKELRATQLEALASGTMNGADAPYVNRRELLRERFLALDIDPTQFLFTDEEMVAHVEKMRAMFPINPEILQFVLKQQGLQIQAQKTEGQLQIEARETAVKEAEQRLKEQVALFELQQAALNKAKQELMIRDTV